MRQIIVILLFILFYGYSWYDHHLREQVLLHQIDSISHFNNERKERLTQLQELEQLIDSLAGSISNMQRSDSLIEKDSVMLYPSSNQNKPDGGTTGLFAGKTKEDTMRLNEAGKPKERLLAKIDVAGSLKEKKSDTTLLNVEILPDSTASESAGLYTLRLRSKGLGTSFYVEDRNDYHIQRYALKYPIGFTIDSAEPMKCSTLSVSISSFSKKGRELQSPVAVPLNIKGTNGLVMYKYHRTEDFSVWGSIKPKTAYLDFRATISCLNTVQTAKVRNIRFKLHLLEESGY